MIEVLLLSEIPTTSGTVSKESPTNISNSKLLFLLDISTSSEKPDYASLINKPTENSLKQHAHKEKI